MFIGSSLKFADLRVRIGCLVSSLSYEWEKKGVRIHLNRWEDYDPGYSGVSKRDEYDEDLVKKSSLMIGLFGDYVGKFALLFYVGLKQRHRIFAECIQMVVGYLDIFVFEEFCFAF